MVYRGEFGIRYWKIDLSCPQCKASHEQYVNRLGHVKKTECPHCGWRFQARAHAAPSVGGGFKIQKPPAA